MTVRSLRSRLAASLLALLLLGAVTSIAAGALQAQSADELLEETSLDAQARVLLRGLHPDGRGGLRGAEPGGGWAEAYRAADGAFYTLYDRGGRAVRWSANLARPLLRLAVPPSENHSALALTGPTQVLTQAFRAPADHLLVVARTNPGARSASGEDLAGDLLPPAMVVALLMSAVVVVRLVTDWTLRPLRRAADEARVIGPSRLAARIGMAGLPTEVQPFAAAVNDALDRVATALEAEKRFTADAAHSLRTPLTVLDLRLQKLEQGGSLEASALRADVDELVRLTDSLLRLARAESAAPAVEGASNLARAAREVAAEMAPLFQEAGRGLGVDAPNAAWTPGSAAEWRDAIAALLDNALVHGSGATLLSVAADAEATVIRVSDAGGGVPLEARGAVFARFHKLNGATRGAGLGLAIVRRTAERHGGTAAFLDGATVEVRTPCSARARVEHPTWGHSMRDTPQQPSKPTPANPLPAST